MSMQTKVSSTRVFTTALGSAFHGRYLASAMFVCRVCVCVRVRVRVRVYSGVPTSAFLKKAIIGDYNTFFL